MTSIEERIQFLKTQIANDEEEKYEKVETTATVNTKYEEKLNILNEKINKAEYELQELTVHIENNFKKINTIFSEKQSKLIKLSEEENFQINEKKQFHDKKISKDKNYYSQKLEEIRKKWKTANIFIKIIRLPFCFKYLNEEKEFIEKTQLHFRELEKELQTIINEIEETFVIKKKKVEDAYRHDYNIVQNEIDKDNNTSVNIKHNLELLNLEKEYITTGDIDRVNLLLEKATSFIEYEKYPVQEEVILVNRSINTLLNELSHKYEKLNISELNNLKEIYKDRKLVFLEELKDNFIRKELDKTSDLLSDVDGKSLDLQQRTAVITNEKSNLVIAGAGSGKTLTIAGKVKYLISALKVASDDILLITFTKKSANEMQERIKEKLGFNVSVKTFHGLGYDILSYFKAAKPDIYSDFEKFILKFKNDIIPADDELSRQVLMYFGTFMSDYVDPNDFNALGDYYCHNKSSSLESILSKISKINGKEFADLVNEGLTKINNYLKKNGVEAGLKKVLTSLKNMVGQIREKVEKQEIKIISEQELNEIEKEIDKLIETDENTASARQARLNAVVEKLFDNTISLKYEKVKSVEELIICNFLYINGVKYIYEGKYKYHTTTTSHAQYTPDFYLPDYDIYIEHFGIDENNRCPQYCAIDELKYLEGIEWKRKIHKENGTIMEETYSYEHKNGVLIEKLKEILKKYNVKMKPLTKEETVGAILKLSNDAEFGEFYKLLETFLSLFKSNGYNESKIDEFLESAKANPNRFQRDKHVAFLTIFKRFYNEYSKELQDNHCIDFNDMINQSTDFVSTAKLPRNFQYKYIIIDEFQDISVSRFKLVDALRKQTNATVMAVGDDWQSIYRFAGSDISIFTKFKDYFGTTEILRIEQTYRNSQQLIDIASEFIMANPNQIKKDLKSNKKLEKPVSLIWYKATWEENELDQEENSIARKLIFILEKFGNEEKNILLLGRNNFDVNILEGSRFFKFKYDDNDVIIESDLFPNLHMKFLSIHKSKGLEADEVIVLNNRNNTTGFPNKIVSDSILSYVMTAEEEYLYAEERRLFYVALTRTKNHCYFMVPDEYSNFIEELSSDSAPDVYKQNITLLKNSNSEIIKCPKCKSGHLVVRHSGSGHGFYGCNNYPQCDFTINDITPVKSKVRCPSCGGLMIKRNGSRGPFYGCKNYPLCKYTLSIEEHDKQEEILNSKDSENI